MKRLGLRTAALAAASAIAFSGTANAVTFNLNSSIDTSTTNGALAQQGFEIAAAYWSSVLTNDSTVNLTINFTDLGNPNVLGQTGSTRADVSLNSVVNALVATGNSALDATATASLQSLVSGGSISAITPVVGPNGLDNAMLKWDNDGSENNSYIWGNTSVLKAMGITEDEYYGGSFANVNDGTVTFNSIFSWDYDPTDGIGAGQYDFIGVAIHEIGHALGFVSGVDIYDINTGFGGDLDNIGGGLMSTLDLFRFSNDPNDIAPGDGPVLDWSTATESYFSIDGGATEVFGDAGFSTGRNTGDGFQASHWKAEGGCGGFLGILNPYLCSASVGEISALDLASYDAMGWNLNLDILQNSDYLFTTADAYNAYFDAAIPEAGTWFMMIAGLGFAGGALRRRNQGSLALA